MMPPRSDLVRLVSTLVIVFALASCTGVQLLPPPLTPVTVASATPIIRSPTPIFIPPASNTSTSTITTAPTAGISITPTSTYTPSIVPTVTTGIDLILNAEIVGCNTSLDLVHQMGEVTNAYLVVQNAGSSDLHDVCATLSASDEARPHPDKSHCLPSLPGRSQVTIKLTVDTGSGKDTSIQVEVNSQEGSIASAVKASCRALGLPDVDPDDFGKIRPLP